MLERKQRALVKIETTYGTDSTPDGSNMVYASAFDVTPYAGDTVTRDRFRGHMGAYAEINVAPFVIINITAPLAGSGEAGTPPAFSPLLRACGMAETEEVGTDVTYDPVSEDFESCTIYYIKDGQQHKATGCRGTFTLNAEAGSIPTIQFQMTGFYSHPTSPGNVSPSAITQADEVPVNTTNTTMSVHGFAACGQSLSVEQGNTINYNNLINCDQVWLTDRQSTGQIQIEAPDLATKDYFTAVESHEQITLKEVTLTHGTTAGNIVTVTAPKTQLSNITPTGVDGVTHYQLAARYIPDQGDDEYSLVFT